MKETVSVFADSDVIISSALSSKGAAYQLINVPLIKRVVSNYSVEEIKIVGNRLGLGPSEIDKILKQYETITVKNSIRDIKKNHGQHVFDIDDAHIVAGAVSAKSQFITTYNIKHYNVEVIKRELNIIVLTPGMILQYLRSQY